jgi:tetratricopeptide (TPR) repeat protein
LADIFVSYTSSDREWARWIALELEKLGHAARVHEWEITGGDDIYAWMEKRHDAADRVLCVVSDEYFKAPYSTLERNAALWQAAAKRPGFVLLVAVKPCKFPTLSDHIRRCELFGVPEEAARQRFRQFIRAPVKPEAVAFPGKVFAVSNIPIRVPEHFLGRDRALADIDGALRRGEGRVAITTLHGLRGVGKTVLAAAYAEHHRGEYRATWWIRAETPDTMRADLVSLGVRLGWVAAGEKEEPALEVVRERLRNEGEGLLLIYDNAIDAASVRPFLPTAGVARALLTSNADVWRGLAAPVEIRVWPKEVGADFLVARTGRSPERYNAEALSDELAGLPLAHEQAAAYCERLGVSFAEYRKRFKAAPARLLDADKDASSDYHEGLTVAKTFALAIDEAAKLHPAAAPVINYASLLAPEPIPLFLFSEACEKFGEPLASQLAGDGLDEAIAALRAFALVDREEIADERDALISTETIRLHRLVRVMGTISCFQTEAAEPMRGVLIHALATVYPRDVFDNPTAWQRARRLDTLALDLALANPPPIGAEIPAALLLNQLARYRQFVAAAYSEAQVLYERALTIYEEVLGPDHPVTATGLNNLALLLKTRGDLAAARPLFERALAIRHKVLGPEHPDLSNSLHNLANLLQEEGDLAGARVLLERALANLEQKLGSDHHNVADSLGLLADVLTLQNDLSGARPLYERALSIREQAFGSEHPSVARSLNNLAALLQLQGELADARPLSERALASLEKTLGADHPETNVVRSGLAYLRLAEGMPREALGLAEAALAGHEKTVGPTQPWTKDSAFIMAAVLDALGRADEAAAVRRRYKV